MSYPVYLFTACDNSGRLSQVLCVSQQRPKTFCCKYGEGHTGTQGMGRFFAHIAYANSLRVYLML